MREKIKLNNKDFYFNKGYGQNFIFDENLLNEIVNDAAISDCDEILEIGAGAGSLTQVLCRRAKKVVSFEIDQNLFSHLTKLQNEYENLTMVFADFMSKSNEEIFSHFTGKIKVVANIPYYITTPIIFKLLESIDKIDSITIMVQKEVAERISSIHSQDNSVLTYTINAVCDCKISRVVRREMFTPPPKVDSAILILTPHHNKYNINDFDAFNNLVKQAFTSRRKTLSNNLIGYNGLDKIQIENILIDLFNNKLIRAQELDVKDYLKLLKKLENKA